METKLRGYVGSTIPDNVEDKVTKGLPREYLTGLLGQEHSKLGSVDYLLEKDSASAEEPAPARKKIRTSNIQVGRAVSASHTPGRITKALSPTGQAQLLAATRKATQADPGYSGNSVNSASSSKNRKAP